MKTVIALPTRNEEQSIQEIIDRIRKLGFDFFLSDEQSTDRTIEIAKKNGVQVYQREGLGKGCGIQKAIRVAKENGYDTLVISDCDCTYPPEDIPKLLRYMSEYDMVVAKRSWENIPYLHRFPNIFHTLLVNILFLAWLHDINSGMRAIKIDKIGKLDAKGFDIEAQITARAIKRKLRIKEVPIKYHTRKGKSKIRIKDGFLITWRILIERLIR